MGYSAVREVARIAPGAKLVPLEISVGIDGCSLALQTTPRLILSPTKDMKAI